MRLIRSLIAFFEPAPSIIVESSLVAITFFAEPKTSRPTSSSFIPFSSETTVASVKTAMSSMISLRRSPNAGALRTIVLNTPLSLLRTRSERASPETSSAIITRSFLPLCAIFSSIGRISELAVSFLSVKRISGLSMIASWRFTSVTKNAEA